MIKECGPDIIVNLIAQSSVALSWENPVLTMDININGTVNIMEAIRNLDTNIRMFIIGSSEQYGSMGDASESICEDSELCAANPYAISKITQEMMSKLYVYAYNLDNIMTRSFNHSGPGQDEKFVISAFAKKIALLEKQPDSHLLPVGDLNVYRDFTDVRDVVRAYRMLVECGERDEIYNVGSGKMLKLKEVADTLISFSDKEIQIEVSDELLRPFDINKSKCNNDKLVKLMG